MGFLHVGLHKTGTSFLQEQVFPRLPDTFYGTAVPRVRELVLRACATSPLFVDFQAVRAEIEQIVARDGRRRFLFSSESLFGNPYDGYSRHAQCTEALCRLFPGARIIMVIRRQDEFVESLYRQSLHEGFSQTVDRFLSFEDGRFGEPPPMYHGVFMNVRSLDYERYVRNYRQAFGQDRVLVLPFELLREDRGAFLEKIRVFMGVPAMPEISRDKPVNRSYSLLSGWVAFGLNRFFISGSRGFGGFIPQRPFYAALLARARAGGALWKLLSRISGAVSVRYLLQGVLDRIIYIPGRFVDERRRRLIMAMHQASNERLDRELGLGLGRYGYY